MKNQALRYNEGKLRYDLLEPYAIEKLTEVFTKGAEKYSDNNWRSGFKWSSLLASLKRHLNSFEKGDDFDEETKLLHIAHVAWNAMALITHYKEHPELDDRKLPFLQAKKVGLDIDGVLADFNKGISNKIGVDNFDPHHWNDPIIGKIYKEISKEKEFWLEMPPLLNGDDLEFEPSIYITSRGIPVEWTEEWLDLHGFPKAKVIDVGKNSKIEAAIDSGIDYFIDDRYENFYDLNRNGICTFLMSAKYNKKHDVGYRRVYSLNDFKQRFL